MSMEPGHGNPVADFERLAAERAEARYLLRLYVSGMTPRSSQAIERTRAICDEFLSGRYDLEVIDIYQQPELAKSDQIIAVPTLIKREPLPQCRLVGDLCDKERVLIGLKLDK